MNLRYIKKALIYFVYIFAIGLVVFVSSIVAQPSIDQKLDAIQTTLNDKDAKWKPSDYSSFIAIIVTVIVTGISVGFNIWQFRTNLKNQRFQFDETLRNQRLQFDRTIQNQEEGKEKELLFNSLKWFEGKSQPRSIGISIIEGYFSKYKDKDVGKVWQPLLVNQAVHLLARSDGEYRWSKTELQNLFRIVELLSQLQLTNDEKRLIQNKLDNANLRSETGKQVVFENENKTGIFLTKGEREELRDLLKLNGSNQ